MAALDPTASLQDEAEPMEVDRSLAAYPQAEAAHTKRHTRYYAGATPFFLIALALGTVSVGLAAYIGASRGVDLPSRVAWGIVGAALALGLLLAPSEAASAFRTRRWGATIAATMLALTCAAFVLTGALGNASAGRVSASRTATATAEHRSRLTREYEQASAELEKLPAARLLGEIEAAIAPLNAIIGKAHCDEWVANRHIRNACARRSPLLAELARAQRRAELEHIMADARAALDAPVDQRPAGEDARILAKYLRAVGLSVTPDRMSDVLVLVAVFSLEISGALALMIARSNVQTPVIAALEPSGPPHGRRPRRRAKPENEHPVEQASHLASAAPNVVRLPARSPVRSSDRAKLAKASAGILFHAEKGSLPRTQRQMAKLIGVSTGTISMALSDLEHCGRVSIRTGAHGTAVAIRKSATA